MATRHDTSLLAQAFRSRQEGRVGLPKVTHGMSSTPTYESWMSMRRRCYDDRADQFPNYGGRGIRVCERWRRDFEPFYEDMGERPEGTTIDRIDVNGHYEPGNVRWATAKEQGRNRRSNHVIVSAEGVSKTLIEWSEGSEFSPEVIAARMAVGMPLEVAMTRERHANRGHDPVVIFEVGGERVAATEFPARFGVPYGYAARKFRQGISGDELLLANAARDRKARAWLNGWHVTHERIGRMAGATRVAVGLRLRKGWTVEEAASIPTGKIRPGSKRPNRAAAFARARAERKGVAPGR